MTSNSEERRRRLVDVPPAGPLPDMITVRGLRFRENFAGDGHSLRGGFAATPGAETFAFNSFADEVPYAVVLV